MAFRFNFDGVYILCDSFKVLTPKEVAKIPQGARYFRLNGVDGICDSAEEVVQLMEQAEAAGAKFKPLSKSETETRKKQGSGPQKMWAEAERYAKKHGISKDEARRILANEKKLKVTEALSEVGGGRKRRSG